MKKQQNVFVDFLNLLEIKYTESFSNQYFNEHPNKYNLFGLSKMLSEYGIENVALQITDKENDIIEITTPFIAHFGKDFVAVSKVDVDEISFYWKGNFHTLSMIKFLEAWTGIVLLAETSEKSIEPEYKKHQKSEQLSLLKKSLFFSSCGLIFVLTYIHQLLYSNIGISLLLLINLAGVYISWLLLLKQMYIQSQYADKICSLFKQKDCNSVLESKAAKLFGVIGWSEIGLGYFLINVIILLFAPTLISSIALINVLTLPYAFWSIWYQYTKAQQWCVLCLIVQALLYSIFIINYLWGYLGISILDTYGLFNLMVISACYIIAILGTNILISKLNTGKTIQTLQQTINSIKADENVFAALLKKQPFHEINDCNSVIRFGNANSPLQLTILSNLYCNPCAKMHKRIEQLLQKTNNNFGVQYIFSAFKEESNSTSKYLIAKCLSNQTGSTMQILNDWFEKGKDLHDDYFANMDLSIESPDVENEFQKHESWRKKSQIRATPTVLVNGYQMPDSYKIEDLLHLTEFNINIK
ncbi:MAG: thioredoxin domain-containing protein [Bacteroidales bacterium]